MIIYEQRLIDLIGGSNKYIECYIRLAKQIFLTRKTKKKAKESFGYIETHHFIPVSFDNTIASCRENKLHCTAREHYILHKLLYKGCSNTRHKILSGRAIAAFMMSNKLQERKITSREYEVLRKICAENMTGKNNPSYGKPGSMLGRKLTEEQINKIKGFVVVRDSEDNYFRVKMDDPRYLNGELVAYNKGVQSKLKGRPREKYDTDEIRNEKIKKSNQNKMWITNGSEDRRLSIYEDLPDGFRKGRSNGCDHALENLKKMNSKETLEKVKETRKRKKEEGGIHLENRWSGKRRYFSPDEIPSEEWVPYEKKKREINKSIYIINDETNEMKLISKDLIIPDGWRRGFRFINERKPRAK